MKSESLSPHCIYLQWRCVKKLNAKLSTSNAANDDNTAASINIYHIITCSTQMKGVILQLFYNFIGVFGQNIGGKKL